VGFEPSLGLLLKPPFAVPKPPVHNVYNTVEDKHLQLIRRGFTARFLRALGVTALTLFIAPQKHCERRHNEAAIDNTKCHTESLQGHRHEVARYTRAQSNTMLQPRKTWWHITILPQVDILQSPQRCERQALLKDSPQLHTRVSNSHRLHSVNIAQSSSEMVH
jgi:hypothetical protein